jgi:hypothetical protein
MIRGCANPPIVLAAWSIALCVLIVETNSLVYNTGGAPVIMAVASLCKPTGVLVDRTRRYLRCKPVGVIGWTVGLPPAAPNSGLSRTVLGDEFVEVMGDLLERFGRPGGAGQNDGSLD